MKKRCIAVADGGRARIYRLSSREDDRGRQVPLLVEVHDLINPDRRLHDGEIWAESRPGLKREFGGGPSHGVDDGRQARNEETDRRFAADVMAALAQAAADDGASKVILVAGAEALGNLRAQAAVLGAGVTVQELCKNLVSLTPDELMEALASADLLPSKPPRD